jgi:hypothetical protein
MPANAAAIQARNAADAAPKAGNKARLRTLDSLDQRTTAAKRVRSLIHAIEGDLGGGDRLSSAERQLVQRAAVLGAVATDIAATWIEGGPLDTTNYCAVINAERRLYETLGLERRPRDVASLGQLLREDVQHG